jgi:hypothetical protein
MKPPPNTRMQRARHPLGRVDRKLVLIFGAAAVALCALFILFPSWGRNGRYFDRRIDETTIYVQEVRRGTAAAQMDRKAEHELLCHLARATLQAGYETFETVGSSGSPDVVAGPGEFVNTATIRLSRGRHPVADGSRVDARVVRRMCRGW